MTRLRIVGVASGSPLSQAAMAGIARDHDLAAIAVPRPLGRLVHGLRRLLGRPADPMTGFGRPLIDVARIASFKPDLIVVASFARILPDAVLAAARIGALNVHMSLLPRHRGIDPIFGTYWHDDAVAGTTIHWMDAGIDTGDIAAQAPEPLERGLPSRELYARLTVRSVGLLADVLAGIARGTPVRRPQDTTAATYESSAGIARARVPHAQWNAERVWHVLSGLGDQYHHLLADAGGQGVRHGRARSYRLTAECEPGRIVRMGENLEVHCRDGIVAVDCGA